MTDIQKGHQITSAFQYIQKIFKECQQIISKVDNQLSPDFMNLYGNRITKDLSASLQFPEKWILPAIFRIYRSVKNELIVKGITITFIGDGIEQPIITAGKVVYYDKDKVDTWDLSNIWFYWSEADEYNEYATNGEVNTFIPKEERHIKEAKIFSLPLISIENDEVLVEKITKPLKKL